VLKAEVEESAGVQGVAAPAPAPAEAQPPTPPRGRAPRAKPGAAAGEPGTKPARRSRAAAPPLIEPPHPHTVIEAVAPEPAAPARTLRKAKALASTATPAPRKAAGPRVTGDAAPTGRRPSSRKR
jgi:hypothetical protein